MTTMRRWRNGLAADVQAALQRLTPDQAPTRPDPISSMQVQNLADLTMENVALEARETPMTETQLGQTYTALAVATARVGKPMRPFSWPRCRWRSSSGNPMRPKRWR